MSHSTSVLSIHIPPTIYTSGSYVEGEIHLNFRSLQDEPIDEVRISLRGRAKAVLADRLNDNPRKQEARMLVDTSRVLWTYGAEYPPPGSDTLRLFFRLKLPYNLPPSIYYSGHLKAASVVYSLETVGLRRGVLKSDKKIHTPLVVLQSDSVGTQLPLGLSDVPWKKFYREQKVRKGFWGVSDPGTVRVELLLPDVPALPLFTKIPYIIDIITTTAPLARSKANAQPAHKAIFPPPPAIHTELMFRLIRRTAIRAQGRYDSGDIEAVWFLGLARSGADVDTDLPEKEWAAADETNRSGGDEVGTWIQRARFQSKMFLIVPPTFDCGFIACTYFLRLKVPFPGAGNDVALAIPVVIVSGIDRPIAREELQLRQGDRLPLDSSNSLRLATLDLPPAYWEAVH